MGDAVGGRPSPLDPHHPLCWGFEVGVLRVAWTHDPASILPGRPGLLHPAQISELRTRRRLLPRDVVHRALQGVFVHGPDGSLSRIAGVESPCTTALAAGSPLGVLLEPVEDG